MSEGNPPHPGKYIRETILEPQKLSVTKAARLLHVGRPALSNLLNGKSALSEDMASKISEVFGVDKHEILHVQTEYAGKNEDRKETKPLRPLVSSHVKITASDIEGWADSIETRSILPVLLRILVNTTGAEIEASDFPAYDNSQKHGWDGYCVSNSVTPWIPFGNTGWEFGCNKAIKSKADSDYASRTNSDKVADSERLDTNFIFVTPRLWNKKKEWEAAANDENKWKEIRVYDALDLEQWIEASLPAQIWLAGQFNIDTNGARAAFDFWDYWANSCDPNLADSLSPKLFHSAYLDHKDTIEKWYQSSPAEHLVISSTCKEEALAFISAIDLLKDVSEQELEGFSERLVIVSSKDDVKRFSQISNSVVPVVTTIEAQLELKSSFRDRPALIVVDRGTNAVSPDITIGLPSSTCFREALEEMGMEHEDISNYSAQCGSSPTILRRQLTDNPAIAIPRWASSVVNRRKLLPLMLAGAWNCNQGADQEILRLLSDKPYKDVEQDIAELSTIDDAPVWGEGNHAGVVSVIDCFYAVADLITRNDIENFLLAAQIILSEEDPALELPEEDRWAANIYDKVKDHSEAIRSHISENLIILAVHGDGLFGNRLGINIADKVSLVIRQLLRGISPELWMSQQGILPSYAEAAPNEFLEIVEEELASDNPAFSPLFEPVSNSTFSRCNRTGMLWALENLAWNPGNLARVILILGELATYPLEDNWSNKPINSLKDILLLWKPHTAANVNDRCDALQLLCERYSETGWELCIESLKPGSSYTSGTNRPSWRNDASGAGHVVANGEARVYGKKCIELALSWNEYDIEKLKDLLQCLHVFEEKQLTDIFEIFKSWKQQQENEDGISDLQDYIRTYISRRKRRNSDEKSKAHKELGQNLLELLNPDDLLLKHFWLFRKSWVEWNQDELDQDNLDHEKRDEEIERLRTAAIETIIAERGIDAVKELALKGDASYAIGHIIGKYVLSRNELSGFIVDMLGMESSHEYRVSQVVGGIFSTMDARIFNRTARQIVETFKPNKKHTREIVQFFTCAACIPETWKHVGKLAKSIQAEYWKTVYPRGHDLEADELKFVIDKLIEAEKPITALNFSAFFFKKISSQTIFGLLEKLATVEESENAQPKKLDRYKIEKAFEALDSRSNIDRVRLARFEYLYSEVLDQFSKYGLPNLSMEMAKSPTQFIQLIVLSFKRSDDAKDPEEWRADIDGEAKSLAARKAYCVLENISVIPGTDESRHINRDDLLKWINEVRALATSLARLAITDQQIGKLLSCSTEEGRDGIWPREEIRDVFEELSSRDISVGLEIAVRNNRGAMARFVGEKATEERDLAKKYAGYASRIRISKPFTSSMLANIANAYQSDADWWESDHRISQRLRG